MQILSDGSIGFAPLEEPTPPRPCLCRPSPPPVLSLRADDIIGAAVDDFYTDQQGRAAFTIFHCPVKRRAGLKVVRVLDRTGPIVCDSPTEAQAAAEQIQAAAAGGGVDRSQPVLAIVNPHAGRGKGSTAWKEFSEILFKGGCQAEVHTTTAAGHAVSLVAGADLAGYSALIVVGGDGTLHEVLQGVMLRSDWADAVRKPLCAVPAGSGNGVAASCHLWTPAVAAHALLKAEPRPMDAATVLQPTRRDRRLALLSVQHGLMTNLDIGTEHLRGLLGGERFTYGALREIATRNLHEARVAWVSDADVDRVRARAAADSDVHAQCAPSRGPPTPILDELTASPPPMHDAAAWPDGWTVMHSDKMFYFNVQGPRWAALDFHLNPWGDDADGFWELVLDRHATRMQGLQLLLDAADGQHKDASYLAVHRVAAVAIEPISTGTWLTLDGEVMPYESLYVEIHKGMLNVVAAPSSPEHAG